MVEYSKVSGTNIKNKTGTTLSMTLKMLDGNDLLH